MVSFCTVNSEKELDTAVFCYSCLNRTRQSQLRGPEVEAID